MWLLLVILFASPIERRSVVVSYGWFRCVLVTFVGFPSTRAVSTRTVSSHGQYDTY